MNAPGTWEPEGDLRLTMIAEFGPGETGRQQAEGYMGDVAQAHPELSLTIVPPDRFAAKWVVQARGDWDLVDAADAELAPFADKYGIELEHV